ncbi:MAG: TraB/GumN family protein [Bacteroidota bacterium]
MRLVLALLAVTVLPVAAQAPADAADDDRRPPLFLLEDGDSRVYLLGSVHVLPEGALPLPPHVEAAYADASVVAFELDLDEAASAAPSMIAAAMDETTLADALTDAQRATFAEATAALGMPVGTLDAFEPWFAGLTVGVAALRQSGLPVEAGGVDAHFFGRAGADDKERVALETVALQTAAFDDLSTGAQVAFLMESVAVPPDSAAAQFGALLEAWASGDDDRLGAMMHDGMSQPEVFEALLVTRNRAWVPQIASLLARTDENALVVVGAGHLVGPQSVVEMLREAGYAVERL